MSPGHAETWQGRMDSNQQPRPFRAVCSTFELLPHLRERIEGIEPCFAGLEDRSPRPSDGDPQKRTSRARVPGIEPGPSGSKPAVLPLDGHPLARSDDDDESKSPNHRETRPPRAFRLTRGRRLLTRRP